MNEKSFKPLTDRIEIPKTSYTTRINLQIGIIDNSWAYQLFAGNSLLDTFIDTKIPIENLPDLNDITYWVSNTIEYQNNIMKYTMQTVKSLLKQISDKQEVSKEELEKIKPEEIITSEKSYVKGGGNGVINVDGIQYIHYINLETSSLANSLTDVLRKEKYLSIIINKREDEKEIYELYKSLKKFPYLKPIGKTKEKEELLKGIRINFCPYCGKKRKTLNLCYKCGREFPKP